MKKVLTIITIIVMLLSISIISNAAVEITEEKLEEAFNKKLQESEDSTGYSFNKGKDTIIMTEEGKLYEVKYNLEDEPKFYIDMKFEKSMTKEDAEEEIKKAYLSCIGFVLIGDSVGINSEDSLTYFLLRYAESIMQYYNQKLEYIDGVEYAKTFYPNEINPVVNDELFTLIVNKQQETATEYILTAELTVNKDGDFSKLDGCAEEGIEDFTGQLTGELADLWNEISATANDIGSNKEDTLVEDNYNTNKKNNVVANIQKIPQTGNEISLQKILYSVIVIATLLGVGLSIYNKKH